MSTNIAFVQDHLVQRGGAERVLLAMLDAAPDAPVITAFYAPDKCYDEFRTKHIRTLALDRVATLRNHHRATLPLLPLAFSATRVDAAVVVCATSGWAQGVRTEGRKVVYFHSLARWIYDPQTYVRERGRTARTAARALRWPLERWDRRTVLTGDRFITHSRATRARLRDVYGLDAELLPPPNMLDVDAERVAIEGLDSGFFLAATRLLPYKNVDVLLDAFRALPDERLAVAGGGPMLDELRARAPRNVTILGECDDARLRWLYASCRAVVSAAFEPFGLTPVEAAAFGRPTIALAAGGFLDTVVDGETGLHFTEPTPSAVTAAVTRSCSMTFDEDRLRQHAAPYTRSRFVEAMRRIFDEELARA